jgi:flagellar biosynthesis activator protein FlaF
MAMSSAANAYSRTARTGLSVRQLEASVLRQCTADLLRAGDAPDDQMGLLAALDQNRQVWSLFSSAARSTDNDLPVAFKTSILRIAAFIFKRTMEIIQAQADGTATPLKTLLEPLIDLNRTLISGLEGNAG